MHAYEELTSAERQLWDAYPTGGSVDFRTGGPEDDPEHGDGWGDARTVRASVVGALLLGGNPGQPGSVPALRLAGARISGTLDLSEAEIGHGMWFDGCWFEQGVRLYGAATRTIEIKGSRLPGLDLTMARVEGRVAFRRTVLNGRPSAPGLSLPADSSWKAACSAVEPPSTAGYVSWVRNWPAACTWSRHTCAIPMASRSSPTMRWRAPWRCPRASRPKGPSASAARS